ncbi:Maltose excess protein 1- chloroplastic [Striga hermonthica]|uniref:Maltose excess protein 1- chloroplastic n=1 Tax=Striga hermonthica TaxID=68872 RepID=A0A9N7R342_STRHE|nr:Maltose excess protein 1- chloroplastic [Striga hermonthica]
MASSLLLSGQAWHARRPLHGCSIPCAAKSLVPASCHRTQLRQRSIDEVHLKNAPFSGQLAHRFKPVLSSSSEDAHLTSEEPEKLKSEKTFEQWDSMTAKFAGAANLPFLLLQLPQIILNTQNLISGNRSALFAVPWLGMLTGLLGNLSLVSYFIQKKETEAVIVQTLGVISTYIVMLQLAMGEAMPLPQFIVVTIVVATGLVLNFMKYFDFLNLGMWRFWEDFVTVAGLSTLPQVMWSTFIPYLPNTALPGIIIFICSVIAVLMARMGKLPDKGTKFLESASGWTATLLFMWMAVAQLWTNLLNPENIKGLSAISMLLAMLGNGLLIPRALFIRDLMWFMGTSWGSVIYGWGNLICLYCLNSISREFFLVTTLGFAAWIGLTFWRDSQAHGLGSPFASFKELVFGH